MKPATTPISARPRSRHDDDLHLQLFRATHRPEPRRHARHARSRRRAVDRDADLAGGAEVDPARSPAGAAGTGHGSRRAGRARRQDGREQGAEKLHRRGLSRLHRAAGDPAQPVREPGLVHRLHALSGRDQPGTAGDAVQLPDAGDGTDRTAGGVRIAARRGDRSRGSGRHCLASPSRKEEPCGAGRSAASANPGCRPHPRGAAGHRDRRRHDRRAKRRPF